MKPINEVNIHTWKLDVDDDHIPEKAIAQANWNQNDEMAADYVKNRPFYSETVEHAETVLLEETIINTSPCTISEYAAPFVVGDSYKVTWDGTAYECVAYQCDGSIAIGNASIVDGFGSDSIDVDFFVGITPDGMLIINIGSQSTHTISISNGGNKEIIIHTIDKKYLPKLIGASGEGENSEIFNSVNNNASGNCSHAEGYETKAIGKYSHAEGFVATASGDCSHAEGDHTTANGDCQHVQGRHNIADSNNTYAHIVGNGTSEYALSNAHTLDWSGNAWFAGTVEGTALILKSSTTDSTKRFKITVDDSGAISATEVTMEP